MIQIIEKKYEDSYICEIIPNLDVSLISDQIANVAFEYDVLTSEIENFFNLLEVNNLLNKDVFLRANKEQYVDRLCEMFQAIRKFRVGLAICYSNSVIDYREYEFFKKLDSADALFTFKERQAFRNLCLQLDKNSYILLNTIN